MVTEPDWIRDALSQARFAPYLAKTGGDIDTAIRLYWWNIDISAAFYTLFTASNWPCATRCTNG